MSSHSSVAKKLLLRSFAGHDVIETIASRPSRSQHPHLPAPLGRCAGEVYCEPRTARVRVHALGARVAGARALLEEIAAVETRRSRARAAPCRWRRVRRSTRGVSGLQMAVHMRSAAAGARSLHPGPLQRALDREELPVASKLRYHPRFRAAWRCPPRPIRLRGNVALRPVDRLRLSRRQSAARPPPRGPR